MATKKKVQAKRTKVRAVMTTKAEKYMTVWVATNIGPWEAWCAWKGERFAVTQNRPQVEIFSDEGPAQYQWAVTHLQSGFAFGSRRYSADRAKEICVVLDRMPLFKTASFHDLMSDKEEVNGQIANAMKKAGVTL